MRQLKDEQLREEFLYRQLFSSGIICFFCKFSEQILRCDILVDTSNCRKHLCVRCYQKYRNEPCQGGHKYEEHYLIKERKVKLATKDGLNSEATKSFHKEHKVRVNDQFKSLEYDLVNLMAYLEMNQTSTQNRAVNYKDIEQMVVKLLGDKKKQERKLQNQGLKRKKAVYINRTQNPANVNGIESCGYNRKHQKGISLILKAFSSSHQKESQLIPHQSIMPELVLSLQHSRELTQPKVSSSHNIQQQSKSDLDNSKVSPKI